LEIATDLAFHSRMGDEPGARRAVFFAARTVASPASSKPANQETARTRTRTKAAQGARSNERTRGSRCRAGTRS
jgi:hypothetical protein